MLTISSNGKLHLTKYLPKARKFTTLCNRGWIVEKPLWRFPMISDNEHINLPSCYWCRQRSESNIAYKIYIDYLLKGMEYKEAYNLAHHLEEE